MLIELARFTSQNRTLFCYSVLSLWIVLLILGMYAYMPNTPKTNHRRQFSDEPASTDAHHRHGESAASSLATKERDNPQAECSPFESIGRIDEGGLLNDWHLLGVMLIVRHGDRGPMVHVRGINSIDCGGPRGVPIVERYRAFLVNATGGGLTNGVRPAWTKTGAFHGNPLLPPFATTCLLGQLTYKGIAQMLHTGDMLRQVYGTQLGLNTKLHAAKTTANASSNPPVGGSPSMAQPPAATMTLIDDGLVEVFSTRYRRTFQSAMALGFGLLSAERWQALNVRESNSIAFCYADCVCPLVTKLQRSLAAAAAAASTAVASGTAAAAPNASAVVELIGKTLLENPDGHMHPMEVRDAVLAVLCHGGKMPCRRSGDDDRMAGVVVVDAASTTGTSSGGSGAGTSNQSDFINIDQDEDNGGGGGANAVGGGGTQSGTGTYISQQQQILNRERKNLAFESRSRRDDEDAPTFSGQRQQQQRSVQCVRPEHVSALMAYTRGLRRAEQQHPDQRRLGLLRAYGLLRHIVSNMLKMMSGVGGKFVLYAGHDRTLEFLMAALNVTGGADGGGSFIPYAARMAFEVYRSQTNGEHYFRALYNGLDVTQQVDVCSGGRSLTVSRFSRRGGKASLCPIENIIRFIHDDYFAAFNTSNFQDACQMRKVFLK